MGSRISTVRRGGVIVAMALAVCVTCGAATASQARRVDDSASAVQFVAAPRRPVSIAGVGALISPLPRHHPQPTVTRHALLRSLPSDDFVQTVGESPRPTRVSLVMYENQFGQTHPGRPDTPSVPNQLAWLVETVSVGPVTMPGPGSAGKVAHPVKPTVFRCRSYVAISAVTGKDLDGFNECTPVT